MPNAALRSDQSKLYYQLAGCYESVFSAFIRERIQSAIRSLAIPSGAQVLEVGVGTGVSLPAYPKHADVTAIDLSPEMLERAQRKVERHDWRHVRLREMDALNLEYPDEHFDYVLSFHVISVVPDSERMMQEMVRVAKPEGTIVLINHFRSRLPWVASVVDRLDPVTRRLGWRTTLRLDDVVEVDELRVERVYKTSPASLFTVVQARKPTMQSAASRSRRQRAEAS
ncbi:MAG: class I SAM-dependent methyltransferase [Planctomycetes bacterium]|nr:class I SAM-dependent methyltransferase [Planctomycetota bacterium]